MGIININDDSFSGDGSLDSDVALQQAAAMIRAGADIVDVGAESARTNRPAISVDEEYQRLSPFVSRFPEILKMAPKHSGTQLFPPLLSINTWRPEMSSRIMQIGGDILNDMSGLQTLDNARICATHGAGLLIMHSVGEPKVPHHHVQWSDISQAMTAFFSKKLESCEKTGLSPDATILDPGFDFAKSPKDSLQAISALPELLEFRRPILVPVSRKTFIGEILEIPDPKSRDSGTIASSVACLLRGAAILRVHNVPAAQQSVAILHNLLQINSKKN